jgi:cytochrome c biogenesis protein CcmG, thiol:disulfide interchange protein DsbE
LKRVPDRVGRLRRGLRSGSSRWTALAAVAILALVAIATISYLSSPPPQKPPEPQIPDYLSQPGVGKRLPDLELEPLTGDGKSAKLDGLAGQVVAVNLWGTWCPPCRQEFPEIAELYEKLRNTPHFRLLAVSCGPGGKEDPKTLWNETKEFVADSGYEMPTYSDPNLTTRSAFDRVAGLRAFPTTFVIDGEGRIRGVWVGYRPGIAHEIQELVEPLLQAAPTASEPAGSVRKEEGEKGKTGKKG